MANHSDPRAIDRFGGDAANGKKNGEGRLGPSQGGPALIGKARRSFALAKSSTR